MKKNGFIATSLIYSFFLIFITLFLTIIVDYIQNKINLEYQESSVKAKLNNVVTAKDFEPGDYIAFDEDCNDPSPAFGSEYIVANVYLKNYAQCGGVDTNQPYDCMWIYSFDLYNVDPDSDSDPHTDALQTSDITRDIDVNYTTITTVNEILYTFNTCDDITTQYDLCSRADRNKTSYFIKGTGNYYPTLLDDTTENLSIYKTKKGYRNMTTGEVLYRKKKKIIFDYGTKKNRKSCKGSTRGSYFINSKISIE